MDGCYIPVVCENCKAGMVMDVLFEGDADKTKVAYELLKPVSDYRIVVVENAERISTNPERWRTSSAWIIKPIVSDMSQQYVSASGFNSYVKDGKLGISDISWHFPTNSTFMVDTKSLRFDVDAIKISHIYGIK